MSDNKKLLPPYSPTLPLSNLDKDMKLIQSAIVDVLFPRRRGKQCPGSSNKIVTPSLITCRENKDNLHILVGESNRQLRVSVFLPDTHWTVKSFTAAVTEKDHLVIEGSKRHLDESNQDLPDSEREERFHCIIFLPRYLRNQTPAVSGHLLDSHERCIGGRIWLWRLDCILRERDTSAFVCEKGATL